MSDKIVISTSCLRDCAKQLNRLKAELDCLRRLLGSIDLEEENGANVRVSISYTLKRADYRVSGSNVERAVNASVKGFDKLSGAVGALAKDTKKSADDFEKMENALLKIFREIGIAGESENMAGRGAENGNDALNRGGQNDSSVSKEDILKKLRDVTPPDKLSSVKFFNLLLNNEPAKAMQNSISVLTGNYTEVTNSKLMEHINGITMPGGGMVYKGVTSVTDTVSDLQYTFNSFFDGCTYEGYEPLAYDSFTKYLKALEKTGNVMGAIMDDRLNGYDIATGGLEVAGKLSESDAKALGIIGDAIGLAKDGADEGLQVFNQYKLLQSMDKEAALSRIQVYKETGDTTLVLTGKCMEKLINASPQEQILFLRGKATLGFSEDAANVVLSKIQSMALDYVLPGSGTAVDMVGSAGDLALNAGNIPEQYNNMMHSTDNLNKIYDVYVDSMNKYEARPTEANLGKAMDAYQAYQQACADSMKTYGDFVGNIQNSHMGKTAALNMDFLGITDAIKENKVGGKILNELSTDNISQKEQRYRDSVKTMKKYASDLRSNNIV